MSIRYTRDSEAVEIQPDYAEEVTEDVPKVEDEQDEDDLDAEMDRDHARTTPEPCSTTTTSQATTTVPPASSSSKSLQPYIRTFIFSRDVPIRIDYCAKYLDLSQVYIFFFLS